MIATPFGTILQEIVQSLPGAKGAIFVDGEGEAVDGFSRIGDIPLRLIGAHWGIIFNHCRRACDRLGLGSPAQILLRFGQTQTIVQRVTEHYIAIVTMDTEANLGRAMRLIQTAQARLQQEML